jgi:hypothetical protein
MGDERLVHLGARRTLPLRTYNRSRTRRRPPDFAPSSETPDFASSFRLREATSGKPGGYVGQAVFDRLRVIWSRKSGQVSDYVPSGRTGERRCS